MNSQTQSHHVSVWLSVRAYGTRATAVTRNAAAVTIRTPNGP